MSVKIIILAIVGCVWADRLDLNQLPPAHVANIFHESGITFVSPSIRHLEPTTMLLPPPVPVTHTFGYVEVSRNSNHPQKHVRTLSFQPISHKIHSSVSAVHSTNDFHPSHSASATVHGHEDDDHSTHSINFEVQSLPQEEVHARYAEHGNQVVHEIISDKQHFEYQLPLTKSETAANDNSQHVQDSLDHFPHHEIQPNIEFSPRVFNRHSTYGLPLEEEINSLPVFQFLSPIVHHTNPPTSV